MSQSTGGMSERVRSFAGTASRVVPNSQTPTVRLSAGLVAVVGIALLTLTRIAVNVPVGLPLVSSSVWFDTVTTAAVVGPAGGIILLGVTAEEAWERIGLILVGVFGLLSALTSAIAVPAVGVTVAGSWLLLIGQTRGLKRQDYRWQSLGGLVAIALLGSLTLSLFGAIGVRPAALRPAGTTLALVGMAMTPLAVRSSLGPLAVGALTGVGTFSLTASAPFVSGAIVLIAGSAVGASAVLLAAAVGGLTATITEGVMRHRITPAVAGLLLLMAGVPSSIPRALSVVLAVALILGILFDTGSDSA
ncbi:hypothetical protein [Halococcus saccharolyticus]|uniref:DUF8068 domain-containing protein n=1 Tax=Halococcus saccharolyticus DSM 5350 TaxID=1227455 RepID=M0MNP8_9EURY|nr:hypothetical protein [Halococcus saccharolyticus]EMA46050.1 hypothetical protein C449_05077 [Halococcus saccharolyticus DSM 5350]